MGFQTDVGSKIFGNIPFKSLEAILDSIPSAIVITDAKGKFLYVNPRGMELYGINNVDLETELYKVEILKPDGSPFPSEEMPITNSIKRGRAVRNVEMTIKRADGIRLHALVSSAPLYDTNGRVFAAIVIFEDITERIQTEIALKESEERYKTLVETSTDAIVVHKNGHFLFANSSALALFGAKTFQELQCRTIVDFMLPNEERSIAKRIAEAEEGQKLLPREEQVVRLDGTHVSVEAIGASIWYSGEQAVLVILRDITQRVELNRKLAEYTNSLEKLVEGRTKEIIDKEKRYHEIYDSFGEALIATDWEFNVIHWNKAAERVTTLKAKDALGEKVYNVLPEMTSVDITPYFEALRQRRPARFMMNTVSRETKKPSIFEVSTYPSSEGIIIIVEDKTEEEQNRRLSAIGATAGMVGHDIRNPLQAITGDLYLIKDSLASMPECLNSDVTESLVEIEKNIGYINKIVADLQDYARPLTPERIEVNLNSLVLGVVKSTDIPSNVLSSVSIEASFNIRTDPTLVRRILTNLIINAVQAMPKGGRLTISASKTADKAIINVTDTGVGIPENIKDKLFTPMITTKAKGQGLGLAVVKRLVEALNGTIAFSSELGKGTTFTVLLPLNSSGNSSHS